MTPINKGDTLYIPVEIGDGAFLGERLITFETLEGPISGFIKNDQVINRGDISFVEAKVVDIDSNRFAIRLHGSFFTTTGLAHISNESRYERAA